MKKTVLLALCAVVATMGFAQEDKAVTARLKQKYGYVEFQNLELGSFYSVSTENTRYKGRTGACDVNGKEIVPCKYDYVQLITKNSFDHEYEWYGWANTTLNGKQGAYDLNGNEIIPCEYESVSTNYSGFIVMKNGKYVKYDVPKIPKTQIAQTGNSTTIPVTNTTNTTTSNSSFSAFAQSYVTSKINEWQKKDEFETTAEWQQRVNERSRNEKINQLTKEAEKKYIADKSKDLKPKTELGAYDADNGVFLVTSDFGNLLVPVPRTEAQAFKANWSSHTKTPK